MALVMLPCDLPWWPQVQRLLKQLEPADEGDCVPVETLVRVLTSIHALCNVGLDPDEPETVEPEQFAKLSWFLDKECDAAEREDILSKCIPCMAKYACRLKEFKPPGGVHFSLQQQADSVSMEKRLAASLLSHAFFSSFSKRSLKTHPTLLDFNFSHFFKHLHLPSQQAKFRSLMHYFSLLSANEPQGSVTVSRRVLSSSKWLTVEDWLESERPLCPVMVRHQPRPERVPEPSAVVLAPCDRHVGIDALAESFSPECRLLMGQPEALAILLFFEALEDNEALLLEGAARISRLNPSAPHFESIGVNSWPNQTNQLLSFADPEDFSDLPLRQYEEDNVLRELNKLYLSFQAASNKPLPNRVPHAPAAGPQQYQPPTAKRLSPIGESFSSATPPELPSPAIVPNSHRFHTNTTTNNKALLTVERKGRFIALGSSGELLPVTRNGGLGSTVPRFCGPRHSLIGKQPLPPVPPPRTGRLSRKSSSASSVQQPAPDSSDDDDDEFHSAKESLDLSEDGNGAPQFGHELDTPQRRCSFAQRLREALKREAGALGLTSAAGQKDDEDSSSSSSSSEGGEDESGSKLKPRRAGSFGFALPEDQQLDEEVPLPGRWLRKALSRDSVDSPSDSNASQCDTDSELEELYEHFSRWLDREGEEEAQDEAVRSFARGLLTRTLSDCGTAVAPTKSVAGVTRSLSEAAGSTCNGYDERAPRRLAAHLATLLGDGTAGPRPVASGSWWRGCYTTDLQLKAVLQWLAASQTQSPCLLFYTESVDSLAKLDTLCRLIVDRRWSVGELTGAVLRFAHSAMTLSEDPGNPVPEASGHRSLFDELIAGVERAQLETEL